MARYIDACELIKDIEKNQRNTEHHIDGRGKLIHVSEHRHFIKMVYEQPTADVVEVVRCKDCVYRTGYINQNGFEVCPISGMDITDDDFCSLGERKEQK